MCGRSLPYGSAWSLLNSLASSRKIGRSYNFGRGYNLLDVLPSNYRTKVSPSRFAGLKESRIPGEAAAENDRKEGRRKLVGTGRFELPTPRTPSECSTRLSHVPTGRKPAASSRSQRLGLTSEFYTTGSNFVWPPTFICRKMLWTFAPAGRAEDARPPKSGSCGLFAFSLCRSLRSFLEHGKLNFLFYRIDTIYKHTYLLPKAVDLAVVLANDLASIFVVGIAVVG